MLMPEPKPEPLISELIHEAEERLRLARGELLGAELKLEMNREAATALRAIDGKVALLCCGKPMIEGSRVIAGWVGAIELHFVCSECRRGIEVRARRGEVVP